MPASLRQVQSPFARRLRRVRAAYGTDVGQPKLTAEEFSARLSVNAKTYRRYERGEVEPPLETLANIRRLTNVSLD
jgi:transcriptional regulator with XRE-family HTH domain